MSTVAREPVARIPLFWLQHRRTESHYLAELASVNMSIYVSASTHDVGGLQRRRYLQIVIRD